ncbi:DUF1684 domain-containing protein [Halpernia frigidisoli]|uniref:DUF1684 domain-containing protein n=1 Tax=Halpernia frigidisoli TaxID=1125876 RepID=A0A1I3DQT2_9FLAO|nr:DUF1684 domain-containing protein [Halpernia frigidisoli]SFH89072.1 hypothetical protein SAMN05443292_0645 [Halpernia frigidisoli]
MKNILNLLLSLIIISCATPNKKSEINDIQKFQNDLNNEYQNPNETPLRGENFKNFTVHPFFPINLKYRVVANFTKLSNIPSFEFPTSSGKTKTYKAYGKATFKLDGKNYILTLYQSQDLMKKEGFEDYLFLPFHDLTNTHETYGGGKYLDLRIPKSNKIILDFNKSYQPYCAYNPYDYNCPIVPEENRLPVRIEAGVKYLNTYFNH